MKSTKRTMRIAAAMACIHCACFYRFFHPMGATFCGIIIADLRFFSEARGGDWAVSGACLGAPETRLMFASY